MNTSDFAPNLKVLEHDKGLIILGVFSGDIPTTADKFSEGAVLIKTDEVDGVSALFQNLGTAAVPEWVRVGSGDDDDATQGLYVVGPVDSGADYEVDGTADDEQINEAMTAANADGGGTVYLLPGEYVIADVLQISSNVLLKGAGIDLTTIKAIDDFSPATQTQLQDGNFYTVHTLLTNKVDPISNITVRDITFNANASGKAGLTSNSNHRAINITNTDGVGENIVFDHIKVTDAVNYSIWAQDSRYVWVTNCQILGGLNSAYDENDGVHLRGVQHFFITENYIDTQGTGSSGDDAIAVGSGQGQTLATSHGVIANNVLASGSRGILVLNDSTTVDTENIIIKGNTLKFSKNSGVMIHKYNSGAGVIKNITVDGNVISNYGLNGAADQVHGVQIISVVNTTKFYNLVIANNIFCGATNAASLCIDGEENIASIKITNNMMVDLAGVRGIKLGRANKPVIDYEIQGNTIDLTNGASGAVGIYLFGTTRGSIGGNILKGTLTGTTYGVILVADASTSCTLNEISHNNFYNWDNGIAEVNSGADPDNNRFMDNLFNTVTSRHTVVGASTCVEVFDGTTFNFSKPVTPLASGLTTLGTSSLPWSNAFSQIVTAPLIIGGSGTTQTLVYKTTTGVGASGADHVFQVGNNGATEAMRILNSGDIGIGMSPAHRLHVAVTTADSATPFNVAAGSGANTNVKTVTIQMTGQSSGFSSQAQFISGHESSGSSRDTYFALSLRNHGAAGMVERFRATANGNIILGNQTALATGATDGFTYIPTCAGIPSGTPTAYTGKVALVFDTTNNDLYIYDAGWLKVDLA